MSSWSKAVAALAALAALAVGGCGEDQPESESTPNNNSSSTSSTAEPTESDTVAVRLLEGGGLSVSNDGDDAFVLLPVGEPERSESADGVTLTYVRQPADGGGEEPELYEAVSVPAGATRQIDPATIGDSSTAIRVCLEVVPATDRAAPAGGDVYRVQGREPGVDPVVACSEFLAPTVS